MEKVNEVGRFKQRTVNGIDSFNDLLDLDLNLESFHPYRIDYTVRKENLLIFLDYVDYLTIPELGIKDCKTRVIKHGGELRCIYLTVNGKKEDVDNVNIVLNRLCAGLKEQNGDLNE